MYFKTAVSEEVVDYKSMLTCLICNCGSWPAYSHNAMKPKHWHLNFHIFRSALVFNDTDTELMSNVNNDCEEEERQHWSKLWNGWGRGKNSSHLERWPHACERGHSYYQRGWWVFGAESLSGEVGVERCGGSSVCRSQKTPGHTPRTAEPTGPEGETEADALCRCSMSWVPFKSTVRKEKAESV